MIHAVALKCGGDTEIYVNPQSGGIVVAPLTGRSDKSVVIVGGHQFRVLGSVQQTLETLGWVPSVMPCEPELAPEPPKSNGQRQPEPGLDDLS